MALSDLAESVHTSMGQLSSEEWVILEDHIAKLQNTLNPAWEQLNWTSLIIDRFLAKAEAAFDHFCVVLRAVKEATGKIEANINDIGNVSLFHSPSSHPRPSSLKSFKVYRFELWIICHSLFSCF